jgi:hypothetical protein
VGARQIDDAAYGTRALTVFVFDASTNQGIPEVTASIQPGDITKKTGPGGKFYVGTLADGTYTINLTRAGYPNLSQEFVVNPAVPNNLEIALGN